MFIPRIKSLGLLDGLKLQIEFDDGKKVIYEVMDDIKNIPTYSSLVSEKGLFEQAKLDASRTVVYWNDYIDLPSDILYEYGKVI